MTILSPKEMEFIDKVNERSTASVGTRVFTKLNITGKFATEEWMVNGDAGGHPLRDLLTSSDNEILNTLSASTPSRVFLDVVNKESFVTNSLYDVPNLITPYDIGADAGDFFITPGAVGKTMKTTQSRESVEYYNLPSVTGGWSFNVTDTHYTFRFTSPKLAYGDQANMNFRIADNGDSAFIMPHTYVRVPRISGKQDGSTTASMGPSYPQGRFTSINQLTSGIPPGVHAESVYWPFGVLVRPIIHGTTDSIAFPHVPGFHRVCSMFAATVGGAAVATACYYVRGESKDVASVNIGKVTQIADGISSGGYKNAPTAMISWSGSLTSEINGLALNRQLPDSAVSLMYPLTWNTDVVKHVSVTLDLENTVTETYLSNGIVCEVNVISGEATDFQLRFDKTYIDNYLRNGLGVFKGVSAAQADEVMATWKDIPVSITMFTVSRTGVTSLKSTTMYSEYKRAREKACKDNNFMDLEYGSGLLMKTVENRMSAVTEISHASLDTSTLASSTSSSGTKMVTDKCVLKVEVISTNTFIRYTKGDVTGLVSFDEAGIEELLNIVLPCYFEGDTEQVNTLLNSEGSVGSLPTFADLDVVDVSISPSSIYVPSLLSMQERIRLMDANESAIFMAGQVTKYRNFNANGVKIARSLTGANVKALLTKHL